ncbi:unnamed protein product [Lampetra planeri]
MRVLAAPAIKTPAGGPGGAAGKGRRSRAATGWRRAAGTRHVCIMELLSKVTVLVGQLSKEEPVEGAANLGKRMGNSAITADPRVGIESR